MPPLVNFVVGGRNLHHFDPGLAVHRNKSSERQLCLPLSNLAPKEIFPHFAVASKVKRIIKPLCKTTHLVKRYRKLWPMHRFHSRYTYLAVCFVKECNLKQDRCPKLLHV